MPSQLPGPDYERAIMDAHAAGEPAPDVEPPADYDMSPEFQQWLVQTMRDVVMQADELGAALTGSKKQDRPDDDQD